MPAPTTSVADADLADFPRLGFLAVEALIGPDEVVRLRRAYDDILDRTVVADGDRMLGGLTRQVMAPSAVSPAFDRNEAIDAAVVVARRLLGDDDVVRTFDMLIFKPAGHPHETPWHQDLAYAEMPCTPAGATARFPTLQFWVALDDVDPENGCMHFVPRPDGAPLLPHHIASGDPSYEGRLLAIDDPGRDLDLATVVACPLPAGGATVHGFGTPHHTPPNRSADRPRRAYIFNLGRRADVGAGRSFAQPAVG